MVGTRSVARASAGLFVVMLLLMGVLPVRAKSPAGPLLISIVSFTVNSVLDQPDDLTIPGTCHTAANTCTLRAAVMQANRAGSIADAVVIHVPAGHYLLNAPTSIADDDASGDLNLTTPVSGTLSTKIIGAGAATTIIDANSHDRVFHVHPGRTADISGVTIQNGYVAGASGSGGGIYNEGSLALSGATIVTNHGVYGGGILSVGDLTVENSKIDHNNVSNSGGGIYNGGNMSVSDSTINQNTAAVEGAGIANAAWLTISDSTLSQNHTDVYGGGIYNAYSLVMLNSTLSGNTAGYDGGGIYNDDVVTLTNDTISGNTVNRTGGAIYNDVGTLDVYNSTIVFNGADADADTVGRTGGIFTVSANGALSHLRNTILAGNNVHNTSIYDECGDSLYLYGANLLGVFLAANEGVCNVFGASEIIHLNALNTLGPLQNNGGLSWTHALLPGSDAIDAGDPALGCIGGDSVLLASDQRGAARISGASCDIGAYELYPTITLISTGTEDGWVLETSENSGMGGTLNSAATTLRLGDDAARKQYRSILSFRTGAALPDTAVITGVFLKVRRQGITGGGNPLVAFKGLMLDVRKGPFGLPGLQTGDFKTVANLSVGPFMPALVGGWYTIDLTGAAADVNELSTGSGLTQMRLRFKLDDNNNAVANILSLYSGNAPLASRPQLIISYYVP